MSPPAITQRSSVAGQLHHRLAELQQRAARHEPAALQILAGLRQAAGRGFGESPPADAALLRLLHLEPQDDGSPPPLTFGLGALLDDALLVGALVATTRTAVRGPESRRGSFGRDLRQLMPERERAAETLCTALLGATREDLGAHLRRAMSLLGGDGLAVDVGALVRDLGAWSVEGSPVQRHWAYDFWSRAQAPDSFVSTTQEDTP